MGGGERIESPHGEFRTKKITEKVEFFEDVISKSEKRNNTAENDVTGSEVKTETISIEKGGKTRGMGGELKKLSKITSLWETRTENYTEKFGLKVLQERRGSALLPEDLDLVTSKKNMSANHFKGVMKLSGVEADIHRASTTSARFGDNILGEGELSRVGESNSLKQLFTEEKSS